MNKLRYRRRLLLTLGCIFLVIRFTWPQYFVTYRPLWVNIDKDLLEASRLKHILIWTSPDVEPMNYLEMGNETFVKRNCTSSNCHVTSDRNLLDGVNKFDVILFHGVDISRFDLPLQRSAHQKYVFVSMESSGSYPVCHKIFNGFFNWTWTYQLNSDEVYGYISIWDTRGAIIGPNNVINWKEIEKMEPIDKSVERRLLFKKYAAAWFVSHCQTPSLRENVALELKAELEKHNLVLHIFGACSERLCPISNTSACLRLLETDYYFYLSFENSFSKDYVTEKLLHALQHYTVPVVYGGANYKRYMPDGIYLDATKLAVPDLAKKMAELINDKEKYYSYFKWHNHYAYHHIEDSPESDPYCNLCSMVNDESRFKKFSVYDNFIEWWNPDGKC